MNEGNLGAASTFAGLFVNQAHAFFLEVSQSCFEVIHTQGDVLNATAAAVLFDELGNRRIISRSR